MILEMLGATLPWHHLLKNKTPESKQKIYEMESRIIHNSKSSFGTRVVH